MKNIEKYNHSVYDHTSEDPKPKNDLIPAIAAIVTILIVAAWIVVLKYYH